MNQSYPSYDDVIHTCREIFEKKTRDYGTAWRILQLPSITDQIMIKAQRIRTIQQTAQQKIAEGIDVELIGIINYALIALIQLDLSTDAALEMPYEDVAPLFEAATQRTKALKDAKNSDYGEAWREMRLSSLVDIILMKLLRIKRIEDNEGKTLISEGVAANYQDIINYAAFALMKL